jgi:hypothetical protein
MCQNPEIEHVPVSTKTILRPFIKHYRRLVHFYSNILEIEGVFVKILQNNYGSTKFLHF